MPTIGSLLHQTAAADSPELVRRIGAAMMRHAIALKAQQTRTTAETAWMNAVLGDQYPIMLERAVRYVCAQPDVYNAPDMTEQSVPDAVLIAAVPNTPGLLTALV